MLKQRNILTKEIEMDATNAIQLLNADSLDQHLYNLIIICRLEMCHPLIKEIMPETNKCSDLLVRGTKLHLFHRLVYLVMVYCIKFQLLEDKE